LHACELWKPEALDGRKWYSGNLDYLGTLQEFVWKTKGESLEAQRLDSSSLIRMVA
jgi:hypothetical protein